MLALIIGSTILEILFGIWLVLYLKRRRAVAAAVVPVQERIYLLGPSNGKELPESAMEEEIIEGDIKWTDEIEVEPEISPIKAGESAEG
jgi:hypothetical protein